MLFFKVKKYWIPIGKIFKWIMAHLRHKLQSLSFHHKRKASSSRYNYLKENSVLIAFLEALNLVNVCVNHGSGTANCSGDKTKKLHCQEWASAKQFWLVKPETILKHIQDQNFLLLQNLKVKNWREMCTNFRHPQDRHSS